MKLGFIGSGKMAAALACGVAKARVCPAGDLVVYDCVPAASAALAERLGAGVAENAAALVGEADVILLCVKPADALDALRAAAQTGSGLAGKLVISIVAGMTLAQLEAVAGKEARVVRVMPNTPALIGQGAAAYAGGSRATAEDLAVTGRIFASVGRAVPVKEGLLDAVTGLSGSGPAYAYLVIEALADGGVLMGLPRELALQLAAQTVAGAAGMVLETGLHPALLRDQVTSPGGTTIAGVEALEEGGARAALIAAVRAATERAQALGKK